MVVNCTTSVGEMASLVYSSISDGNLPEQLENYFQIGTHSKIMKKKVAKKCSIHCSKKIKKNYQKKDDGSKVYNSF